MGAKSWTGLGLDDGTEIGLAWVICRYRNSISCRCRSERWQLIGIGVGMGMELVSS